MLHGEVCRLKLQIFKTDNVLVPVHVHGPRSIPSPKLIRNFTSSDKFERLLKTMRIWTRQIFGGKLAYQWWSYIVPNNSARFFFFWKSKFFIFICGCLFLSNFSVSTFNRNVFCFNTSLRLRVTLDFRNFSTCQLYKKFYCWNHSSNVLKFLPSRFKYIVYNESKLH